jgi:iron complex outermembrane receptor protein
MKFVDSKVDVLIRLILIIIILFISTCVFAQDDKFEQIDSFLFGDTTVELASGIEESILDAPATMIVITAKEIQQRGYTNLAEVIMDLPGFDISYINGISQMNVYQRGYRTPFTQRTLIMIDGKVDNHLWSHTAEISRQYPLSNIKKVEVLYGPASAVYGPNAFLGIINLITKNGSSLSKVDYSADLNFMVGSYDTRSVDATVRGKIRGLNYSMAAKVYRSDEADLSDKWGFLSDDVYGDEKIWGPLLDFESRGVQFGEYHNPKDDYGIVARVNYGNVTFGWINWQLKDAYGATYTADHVQNNTPWNKNSNQIYMEYDGDITPKISTSTLVLYRENRQWGQWAEAIPDGEYSYISYTNWNSMNNSWLFKPNFNAEISDKISISGGMKYERKELTKNYDIPGYWDAYSTVGEFDGVGHSTDTTYVRPPMPSHEMPSDNLILTEDLGGFVQGILDVRPFRFNMGIRYDENSVYGSSVNPRLSAIYKFSENNGALKLLYGEAFQEPAPIQLWGGWTGRNTNPDLEPEKVRNLECIAMIRTGKILHDLSVYYAKYENVIKEEAENAGKRDIYGVEYRSKFTFPNFIPKSDDISGYLNYTFTDATSSIHYNHDAAEWEDGDTELGDIAPHKINMGLNVPIQNKFNVNLRGNYVSNRLVYTRNALRAEDYEIDSYFVLNGNINYNIGKFSLSAKVKNILDEEYFHPGIEQAEGGNDFSKRSTGFRNSLVPQEGRSYYVSLGLEL